MLVCRLILIINFSYLATLPVDSRLVNSFTVILVTQAKGSPFIPSSPLPNIIQSVTKN